MASTRRCPECGNDFPEDARYCPHDGARLRDVGSESETLDPRVGRLIDGRYRIVRRVGEGGMGIVYQACHRVLNRNFALKVLREELAADTASAKRFMQEAQAATAIGHPNIVDISDFGYLDDGAVYFVMEYLEGEPLTDVLAEGPMRPREVAAIARQIASALAAAHERGIIHRDLKPDNVILVRHGEQDRFVKVLDFGIAKVGGNDFKLTKTGMVFGTPFYMSPEQASGQELDGRTDVYALGVIMYELVTGRVPFEADTFMGVLTKHMEDAPVPPSRLTAGSMEPLGALEGIILRALEKRPEDRYATMGQLQADLDAWIERAAPRGGVATRRHVPPMDAQPEPSPAVPLAAERRAAPDEAAQRTVPAAAKPERSSGRPSAGQRTSRISLHVAGTGSWKWVVGGALLAFLVGSGVALAFLWKPTEPTATPLDEPAASETPERESSTALADRAGESRDPSLGAATEPDDGAGTSLQTTPPEVRITSEPEGAHVLIDGTTIGNAPVEIERPSHGVTTLSLRLPGYREEQVQLAAEGPDAIAVDLQAVRKRRAPRQRRPEPKGRAPENAERNEGSGRWGKRIGGGEVVDPWAQ